MQQFVWCRRLLRMRYQTKTYELHSRAEKQILDVTQIMLGFNTKSESGCLFAKAQYEKNVAQMSLKGARNCALSMDL